MRLINAFGSFKPYEAAASVRGIEPSVVAFIELESLELLIKQDIEISNAFLSAFMDKVIVFKNFINFKEVYDSTSRVGHLLYTELERFNKVHCINICAIYHNAKMQMRSTHSPCVAAFGNDLPLLYHIPLLD